MKYIAKPIEVSAGKISSIEILEGDDTIKATFEDGSELISGDVLDEAEIGDYAVTWPGGEISIYPPEEFESRFGAVDDKKNAA